LLDGILNEGLEFNNTEVN